MPWVYRLREWCAVRNLSGSGIRSSSHLRRTVNSFREGLGFRFRKDGVNFRFVSGHRLLVVPIEKPQPLALASGLGQSEEFPLCEAGVFGNSPENPAAESRGKGRI